MTDSEDEETADGTEAEDETTPQDADAVLGSSDTDYLETAKMGSSDTRHETVDQVTQEAVLERDQHRCRACGVKGPGAGGLADLEVHHADRDPDDIEEHHMSNLLTLCRSCHSWHHKRAQPSESPIRLTDADLSELLSHDIEILRILDEHGPLRTGAIEEALSVDMTVTAVRERLWLLAGLDNHVDDRAEPPVMKDVASQEWGLIGDIVTTARGHIPDDPKHLVQRVEDELMRRAFDRGCDRETIMEVFDSSRRGTFYKEKRAKMYDFPLDAVADASGRPSADGEEGNDTDAVPDAWMQTVTTKSDARRSQQLPVTTGVMRARGVEIRVRTPNGRRAGLRSWPATVTATPSAKTSGKRLMRWKVSRTRFAGIDWIAVDFSRARGNQGGVWIAAASWDDRSQSSQRNGIG